MPLADSTFSLHHSAIGQPNASSSDRDTTDLVSVRASNTEPYSLKRISQPNLT